MSTKNIWVRRFTRHEEKDDDFPATEDFMKENLTDYFGQFLQEGENSTISTFDKLVTVFWSKYRGPWNNLTNCENLRSGAVAPAYGQNLILMPLRMGHILTRKR
jgi:hypothetical protein